MNQVLFHNHNIMFIQQEGVQIIGCCHDMLDTQTACSQGNVRFNNVSSSTYYGGTIHIMNGPRALNHATIMAYHPKPYQDLLLPLMHPNCTNIS